MSSLADLLAESVAEIEKALRDPEREPGEVTYQEYAKQQKGLSEPQARRDLERGVAAGKLTKRRWKDGRVYRVLYRPKVCKTQTNEVWNTNDQTENGADTDDPVEAIEST